MIDLFRPVRNGIADKQIAGGFAGGKVDEPAFSLWKAIHSSEFSSKYPLQASMNGK